MQQNIFDKDRCRALLAHFPAPLFRMNDAYEVCVAQRLGKYRGTALWNALQKHGLIVKTERPIKKDPHRCWWRRAEGDEAGLIVRRFTDGDAVEVLVVHTATELYRAVVDGLVHRGPVVTVARVTHGEHQPSADLSKHSANR